MAPASPSIRHHPLCAATRRDGAPCGARALPGERFCFVHHPDQAARQRESRERGGRNKATAVRVEAAPLPSYLRPILGAVVKAIADVRDGRLSPAQGSSIAALAGVAIKLVTASQFEERLSALEQQEGVRST
jgi:hypothetical protein